MPKASLTTGNVGRTLFKMTGHMVMGIFAIVAFNLADTYFVARLGTPELAAISFTFPVVMFIASIALGLGMGTSAVISRAIGGGNHGRVRRLTTDSLALALVLVAIFAGVGLLTIDPVFGTLLGAGPKLLPLIRQYMTIWYVGVIFVVVPMVGNNAIRATGDMKVPSLVMMAAAGLNVVLDPLLIFGLWGFPRMGLRGAAVATVIARAATLVLSLAILHFRERMLDFSLRGLRNIWDSWKRILYVGLPSAATNVLVPLCMGVATYLAAGFGEEAVAALGAGTRVQALALMVVMALSSAMVPFVGQNWGARNFLRIREARKCGNLFAVAWGLLTVVVLLVSARWIARLFSDDPLVIGNIVHYLWIVPIGYGMRGICRLTTAALNAINRPVESTLLNLARMFLLFVPLAWLGSWLRGLPGLFGGIALANILAGILSLLWGRQVCVRAERRVQQAGAFAATAPFGDVE